MNIDRVALLLSAPYLEFASDMYDWACKGEREFQQMSDRERRKVRSMYRGATYQERAVNMTNQVFAETISENDLDPTSWNDLERSYRIQHSQRPNDMLGLIYHWFHGHVNLYMPGLTVKAHRCFKGATGPEEIKWCLFHAFLDWAEHVDCLDKLNPSPTKSAYIDEIGGTFMVVIECLTGNNSYFQRIFEVEDGEGGGVSNISEPTNDQVIESGARRE